MTRKQASKHRLRGTVGVLLVAIGAAVLVLYSAAMAWEFHAAMNSAASYSLGFLGSIGLASLHALRVVALDHGALLSVLRRMLLSCSALIVMLIGIALLTRGAKAAATETGTRDLSERKGDQ